MELELQFPQIDEAAKALQLGFFRSIPPDPDKSLFHYTSVSGMQGIISSRSVFATHYWHLNDSSEMRYALNLFNQHWDRVFSGSESLGRFAQWPEFLKNMLVLFVYSHIDIYVTCFCEEPDLLSQWRGYSSQQVGYAIGFDPGCLRRGGRAICPRTTLLFQIEYEPEKQAKFCSEASVVVKSMIEGIAASSKAEALDDQQNRDLLRCAVKLLIPWILMTLLKFKHPGFGEEKEWRLALLVHSDDQTSADSPPSHVHFRDHLGRLIPYVRIPIAPQESQDALASAITEISFGPSLLPSLVEHGLRAFLTRNGLSSCRVTPSTIPFRG